MQFKLGILGATGYIGVPYRKEIREASGDATIIALCARRKAPLEQAAREDGALLATTKWQEVVEHPEVNLVLVATPDAFHHEAVLAAAAAGKHMICEKPLGMNVAEAKAMWNVYRDSPLASFVPYWTRYLPCFVRAREIVQAGDLGTIQSVMYRWFNPRPAAIPFTWRDDASVSSAGSIADVGSHAYDTMRWILNQEATEVLAHATVLTEAKPDLGEVNLTEALAWGSGHTIKNASTTRAGSANDYASISFVMNTGTVGTLILSHASSIRKGLAPELELHGSEGSLAVDRNAGSLTLVRPGSSPELLVTLPVDKLPNRFEEFVFPALRSQLESGAVDHPHLADGVKVQRFTDAAALSAKKGAWVQLSEL